MTGLVWLYPAGWRARYAQEFRTVLAGQKASVGMIFDVLAGAVDAHLHPQVHVRQTATGKGDTMTAQMLTRCMAGGPKPTGEDKKAAAFGMRMSSLTLAVIYLVLTKIYHGAAPVQAFGAAAFPAVMVIYEQRMYLHKRGWATQVVMVGGMLALLYGFMLVVCVVALDIAPALRGPR